MQKTDLLGFTENYFCNKGLRIAVAKEAAKAVQPLVTSIDGNASVLFEDAFTHADGRENLASIKAKEVIKAAAEGFLYNLKRRRWTAQHYLVEEINRWGVRAYYGNRLDEYDISGRIALKKERRAVPWGIEKLTKDFESPWMTPYHMDPKVIRATVQEVTHAWLKERGSYAKSKSNLAVFNATGKNRKPLWMKALAVILVLAALYAGAIYYIDIATDPVISEESIRSFIGSMKATSMEFYDFLKDQLGA